MTKSDTGYSLMASLIQTDVAAVEQVMDTMLAEARAGDRASAVMAAMLIHRYPETAQKTGVSTLYEWLLSQALQSNDPELLACLAEELMAGKRLAGDGKMAYRAAKKADGTSGFMGAYILGRMMTERDPVFAIKQFRKGRKAGHIPSMVREHRLRCKRAPFFGEFAWLLWFNVMGRLRAASAAYSNDTRRLWRGSDVVSRKEKYQRIIGTDRQFPFARIDGFVPAMTSNNTTDVKDGL